MVTGRGLGDNVRDVTDCWGAALIRPEAEISRGGTLPVWCRSRLGVINDLYDLSFWDWPAIDRSQRALQGAI